MIHGGDVYTNGILKGKELLDFSSNINPFGIPKIFKEHINEALDSLVRYPDVKYRKLREALSKYTNISMENIVIGNGAAEVLDWAIASLKSIVILNPSFAEYEFDAKKWNVIIEYLKLEEKVINKEHKLYEFCINYEEIIKMLSNKDSLIIANPNNPNGSIIDKEGFKKVLNYAEENKKIIIIDEAFIEFAGIEKYSFCYLINEYKCLFIVRALTKFFGMPGIRLGYGLSSNKELLKSIKEKQNPWNINSFAEVAGLYVFSDKDYINKSIKWIDSEREYMKNSLINISFIEKVYKTYGNFILVKLKNIDCNELYDKLLNKGILIRKANNYRGLDNNYVRFAIKDREKNNILINTLKSLNE